MALSDKDTDDQMAADWAEISARYAPEDAPAPAKADGAQDPPDAETEGADGEKIPVSREADGKFKAQPKDKDKPQGEDKAKLAKPAAARADSGKQPREGADKGAVAAAAAAPAAGAPDPALANPDLNRAPSSWKPLARAEWDKVPPAVRGEIYRREQDFLNGQQQLMPDAQLGKEMREVIKPYEMMIQAEGGTAARAVSDLFRTAAVFRVGTTQQKYQAIAVIARQFGIDLRAFAAPAAAQPGAQPGGQPIPGAQPGPFRDPRVDQLLAQQESERRASAQRETQAMESTVTRWMNETDAQGNPKRPYLNDVINEMSALVAQVKQADPTLSHVDALNRAYEAAIWAHPDVRQLLTQQQQADLEAKRRTDNQARVRDARRAGSVNVPRRGSTPAPAKPGTIEETIRETARELGMFD